MPENPLVEQLRGDKERLDPFRPYLYLNEQEPGPNGTLRSVNTIFLTNRECPFRCIMCDLWKHTLDEPTPPGAIPGQIEYALARLPEASVVKLYNNGNFFDSKAIPPQDLTAIAKLLAGYDRVIVENHPKLCGPACLDFKKMLDADLEVALGLETIHPEVLPRLNKQITAESYAGAVEFLTSNGIGVRTFLLLNPPYLTEPRESIEWTLKSVEFASGCGSATCSIIPTRSGNGLIDKLAAEGAFVPPTLAALEEVFERALQLRNGRIFVDLWDLQKFSSCGMCFQARKERLRTINLKQRVLPAVDCNCRQASC